MIVFTITAQQAGPSPRRCCHTANYFFLFNQWLTLLPLCSTASPSFVRQLPRKHSSSWKNSSG